MLFDNVAELYDDDMPGIIKNPTILLGNLMFFLKHSNSPKMVHRLDYGLFLDSSRIIK